jgi:hypothetical protein
VSEQYIRNPNTACAVCGKKIYRRPFALKNKERVFCSLVCYGISNRKEIPCVVCGTLLLSGLNKKTCSRACSNKHRAGIKYLQSRPKDKVNSHKQLKLRLLGLRGKICERCNYDTYEILQIHHKDRNRKNNELNNLELICPNCHFEEHYLEKNWIKT